jgi:protein arginine N-methyltransferase 2
MNNCIPFTLIETLTELLRALLSSKSSLVEAPSSGFRQDDTSAVGSTDAFLASRLQYTKDEKGQEICLLKLEDGGEVGVMMEWERDISKQLDCLPNDVRVAYDSAQCAIQSTNFA